MAGRGTGGEPERSPPALTRRLLGRVATAVGGAVDGALLEAMRFRFGREAGRASERPLASERLRFIEEASAFYRQPELLAGDAFFEEPALPSMAETRVGQLPGGEIVDLRYPSRFEPRWPAMRRSWNEHPGNRFAHVRLLRHLRPRPALICLHGYGAGHYSVEERSFPVRALHQRGLDVALFVLPFHALRATRQGPPRWPSPNVARTNEGFAQAMLDLRGLVRWLRERGAPSVSVCGMSLGGYTAALLSTLEPMDFACFMIPVASFAELFWHHGEGRRERREAEQEGTTMEHLRRGLEVVSPLARSPRVPGRRTLVLDAAGDQIVPGEHAAWLAAHFGARRRTFAGGHLLLGRRGPFAELLGGLEEAALLPR